MKIGQSPEAAWNLRLSKLLAALSTSKDVAITTYFGRHYLLRKAKQLRSTTYFERHYLLRKAKQLRLTTYFERLNS